LVQTRDHLPGKAVELDVRRYKGNILIEMFGKNIFPRVGEVPHLLTLGPYHCENLKL
jgi:hypothetical protein